jgi:hypothetical protein
VAKLNFCLYWTQTYYVQGRFYVRASDRYGDVAHTRYEKRQKRHRIIGRTVNTAATKAMATYLEEAVERLTRESVRGDSKQFYSTEANSFRAGATDILVEKLHARYHGKMRVITAKCAKSKWLKSPPRKPQQPTIARVQR